MKDDTLHIAEGKRSAVRGPWSEAISFALYLCLAIVTTHPLWLHLVDAVPHDIGDPLLNTWILAWDAHALLSDPLHLFDANIYYPLANTLAYSEHLLSTAMLGLPLQLVTQEPVAAYNLSLLLSFPLAGLGMYLLVLNWTHRRGAAFLAGLAFAFAPYRLAAIAHLQLLTIQWLPFSLLAMEKLFKYQISNIKKQISKNKYRRVRYWLLLVVFIILQILASWYLAVFTALVLGIYALAWLAFHRRVAIRGLVRIGVVALIVGGLALPFALPYLNTLPKLQAARPPSLAASFAVRPTDYLAAAPYLRIAGPLTRPLAERPGLTEENVLFLGFVAPLLAILGLATARPRWRAIALGATLVISLTLTFAGPYLALTRLVPSLSVVRVPPRWIIPATFALAALAGWGGAWLCSGRRTADRRRRIVTSHLLSAVCCLLPSLLLIAESFAAPLPLATVGSTADLPPVYHFLRSQTVAQPPDWAVVELPMHVAPAPEFPETKRLYASSLGWWGLVNGYSGFTPQRQMRLDEQLADFPSDESLATLRELGASGVRYLVVHPDEAPLDRSRWEMSDRWTVERQTTLLPRGRFGPDELYLINPYGDDLITNPSIATDSYWSLHAPTPINARFTPPTAGAEVRLLVYSLFPTPYSLVPTETRLTLYWQTSTSLNTNYTVFAHSLNADGELIGQADGPPLANHYPTTDWQVGEIVQDSRLVPSGERYLVGLYDPATEERLPAFASDGARLADDAVELPIPSQE